MEKVDMFEVWFNEAVSRILKLLAVSVFVLIFIGTAYPCTCVKDSLKGYYKKADSIVTAKVLEVTDSQDFINVKLEISAAWKQKVPQIISIILDKDSCNYTLEVGEEHLLYLKRLDSEKWTTNKCMGNLLKNKSANVQKWLKINGKKAIT
jgi:hypothetical protein